MGVDKEKEKGRESVIRAQNTLGMFYSRQETFDLRKVTFSDARKSTYCIVSYYEKDVGQGPGRRLRGNVIVFVYTAPLILPLKGTLISMTL